MTLRRWRATQDLLDEWMNGTGGDTVTPTRTEGAVPKTGRTWSLKPTEVVRATTTATSTRSSKATQLSAGFLLKSPTSAPKAPVHCQPTTTRRSWVPNNHHSLHQFRINSLSYFLHNRYVVVTIVSTTSCFEHIGKMLPIPVL